MAGKILSILQDKKECYLTRATMGLECVQGLQRHHAYAGARRTLSERYGLCVWLCPAFHNEPPHGVHHNEQTRLMLQSMVQREAMRYYGWTKEQFMEIFGKNYLEDGE